MVKTPFDTEILSDPRASSVTRRSIDSAGISRELF